MFLVMSGMAFSSCSDKYADVDIDYSISSLYSEDEMDAAIKLIEQEFDGWEGCEMHSIKYAGDGDMTAENMEWVNSIAEINGFNSDYTECISFLVTFHSPVDGGGAWIPNTEYTDMKWWLARKNGGSWKLITWDEGQKINTYGD